MSVVSLSLPTFLPPPLTVLLGGSVCVYTVFMILKTVVAAQCSKWELRYTWHVTSELRGGPWRSQQGPDKSLSEP